MQVHALRITIKLDFWGIWADAWIVDRAPRGYLYTKTRLRLWLRKARTFDVRRLLQVNRSSNESAVQQE